ncbi:MAG TPA: helix-turn-helix transcriptional regulator [Burkholderiales bacterium]|nr:helix-turn-helix transcriptional regulator [Burkholderiales bacterium]
MGAREPKPGATEADADEVFLARLGEKVRDARLRRGLTRKMLARDSAVSERYLAELEAGRGNFSVLLLRKVAGTLGLSLAELMRDNEEQALELTLIHEFLQRLPKQRLARVRAQLQRDFAGNSAGRSERIALIGLRGAGKSTLGEALAGELKVPFIELDREIEREAGTGLSEIFLLYGQQGYRRYEQRCLEKILESQARCVIATGGSIVSETATYDLLRSSCYTVWLKAKPEEHMSRVMEQGDMRPMEGNTQAMADLKRILQSRAALYGQADAVVDTAGRNIRQSLKDLKRATSP